MPYKKISVNNLGSVHTDTVVVDRYKGGEIIFASMVGYASVIKATAKRFDLNLSTNCYITDSGYFKTRKEEYQINIKRDNKTDYSHLIVYAKDKISYNEDGTEDILLYIFETDRDKISEAIYNKLSKASSVPMLREWKEYIYNELQSRSLIRGLNILQRYREDFLACRIEVTKSIMKDIITKGLREGTINILGNNNPSPILSDINGLNSYLNDFGEVLADKIQSNFKARFTPGEDEYDAFTNYIDDFIYHENNTELFEAQKSLIQSVVNNLKVNDTTFVVAEMGSGKTVMGASIPYAHNANRTKGFNCVVVCPSHLTLKWKREIEDRIPNSRGYVVHDYNELIALEGKLRNKLKTENSYVILSKERAKNGYDVRPAAIWSKIKKTFVCPECGKPLYTIEFEGKGRDRTPKIVFFDELSMTKQYSHNLTCMNKVKKWDNISGKYTEEYCNAKLWGVLNRDDEDHKWFKLGTEGWVYKNHIVPLTEKLLEKDVKLSKKESSLLKKLMEQYELYQNGNEFFNAYKGPRKYSVAEYIKKKMNKVFDYCIVDEAHNAKGLTEQGQAVADLIKASKKSILLTGTLLNGYADGLYYLLWRTVPKTMVKEGFRFSDEAEFARMYGVHSKEYKYELNYTGGRTRKLGATREKRLPGVSPLVFTKFLLNNAVFLSLSDMSNGLPDYQEIPVPVDMSPDLYEKYINFENAFKEYASSNSKTPKKAMSSFLQNLLSYPDCPHMVENIIDPITSDTIYSPICLEKATREKEERLLELVREKINNGEKVMIYYTNINKTDIGESLISMFKENDIVAHEMKSSVKPEQRESWVESHLNDGMEVMICNPSLVETGLDLLEFTSIIFYQLGYNLFTMRQASRRSWRLSQTKDIKVYFMYYKDTIQEQILSLMATKLQASMAIEGKFSEEGLRAMSDNQDLMTQIANNVVEGIKDTVSQEIFKANAFVKSVEAVNRPHINHPSLFKFKLNKLGNITIYSDDEIENIKDRKKININKKYLNNPIRLFDNLFA